MRRRTFLVTAAAAVLAVLAVGGALAARELYVAGKLADAAAPEAPVQRTFGAAWPDRPGPKVLLIGDSRVADWRHHLPADLAVAERGLPGETARQLTGRFEAALREARPAVVVVQAGINDLVAASLGDAEYRRTTTADLHSAFALMADAAAETGACLVLTTIVPPAEPSLLRRAVWNPAVSDHVAAANDALRRLADPPRVAVLDLAERLAPAGDLPDAFRRDTLHLTPAAYERMNDALRRHLADHPTHSCGDRDASAAL